jgi:hypothetical protein
MEKFVKYIVVILIVLGLLFMMSKSTKEGFMNPNRCPNILIQKGQEFYLYNSRMAKVPGVNPLRFNSLEDYTEFINWQRSQGIRCPVLYLQRSYDTQGNETYAIRPSPTDPQGGLQPVITYGPSEQNKDIPPEISLGAQTLPPETKLFDANRNDPPYNYDSYPGFDQQNQYIGLNTPLDKMFNENPGGVSPNPMNTNWGGAGYTQDLVDRGYYKDNEIAIYVT